MQNKALTNYFKILESKFKPRFKLARKSGLLDRRIKQAFKVLENCELCERQCHKNRLRGEIGWCQVKSRQVVTSMFDHWGEEPFFVPSFTIFFWSCTFACQYCQNWTISQRAEHGSEISEKELAKVIDAHAYCRNINFVGGEPTPQLPFILKTLKYVKADLPVIWNSNFYMSKKSMSLLKGVVDVYLSDWKYWSDKCALRLSKVLKYQETVARNHKLAFRDAELVIRHLVLPGHYKCCTKPILYNIEKNYGDKVVVNLMGQYRPEYKAAQYPKISQPVSYQEFSRAVKLAEKLRLNFVT